MWRWPLTSVLMGLPSCAGMFYAYVKLKEQETRNLEFLCECVMQGRTDQMKVVPIFSRSAKWRK